MERIDDFLSHAIIQRLKQKLQLNFNSQLLSTLTLPTLLRVDF